MLAVDAARYRSGGVFTMKLSARLLLQSKILEEQVGTTAMSINYEIFIQIHMLLL